MPELWEIGLDPAVQGVPVKKKLSVVLYKLLQLREQDEVNDCTCSDISALATITTFPISLPDGTTSLDATVSTRSS